MIFFIVSWKEFEDRKMTDRAEIIKAEDKAEALSKMRQFNAEKRLTTTDYQTHNLTELLDANSLEIVEKVITE